MILAINNSAPGPRHCRWQEAYAALRQPVAGSPIIRGQESEMEIEHCSGCMFLCCVQNRKWQLINMELTVCHRETRCLLLYVDLQSAKIQVFVLKSLNTTFIWDQFWGLRFLSMNMIALTGINLLLLNYISLYECWRDKFAILHDRGQLDLFTSLYLLSYSLR